MNQEMLKIYDSIPEDRREDIAYSLLEMRAGSGAWEEVFTIFGKKDVYIQFINVYEELLEIFEEYEF